MRRFILLLWIVPSLLQSGCGKEQPATAPDDFPLVVEFVPIASTFSNQADIAAVLTNRSRGTIYYLGGCPPAVQRREGDQWVVAELAWQTTCPADAPGPSPVAPGGSVRWGIPRTHLSQPVLPGVYRFPTNIGKMGGPMEPHWSGEFEVTE